MCIYRLDNVLSDLLDNFYLKWSLLKNLPWYVPRGEFTFFNCKIWRQGLVDWGAAAHLVLGKMSRETIWFCQKFTNM